MFKPDENTKKVPVSIETGIGNVTPSVTGAGGIILLQATSTPSVDNQTVIMQGIITLFTVITQLISIFKRKKSTV